MRVREFLGKKHAIYVLLAVYENPGIVQNKLADKSQKGSTAKYSRIKEAISLGLITETYSEDHWSARNYYTTPEGSKIAEHIIEMERVKNNNSEMESSTETEKFKANSNSCDFSKFPNENTALVLCTVYIKNGVTEEELLGCLKISKKDMTFTLSNLVDSGCIFDLENSKYTVTKKGIEIVKQIIGLKNNQGAIELNHRKSI